MNLIIVFLAIVLLVILIAWLKVNPFLAFLIVCIGGGLALGVPVDGIVKSVEKGIGDLVGSILIIICLGAMLGKIVADSGAAQRISEAMIRVFGKKHIQWGMVITGFVIGIPLFYGIGFILMVPLIFSVVYRYKLPAVYVGIPMLAALSVTHGFLPPHPSPTVLVMQFGASMGHTLLFGLLLAIPAIIVAGPLFAKTLKKIEASPLETFKPRELPREELPGVGNSFFTALLPVLLLMAMTIALVFVPKDSESSRVLSFFGDASVVMIISIIVATFTLGIWQGKKIAYIMNIYTESVKDIAMILLIIAGAGALKEVLMASGVSDEIAASLQTLDVNPLILGWLIAAVIRVAVGSATVAGLTAAGIVLPLIKSSGADPNLMVLSIGAGSLVLSHVNDAGFWMFKEYFNVSLKDTFKSWTVMESLVAIIGLIGVLILDIIFK